MLLAPKTMLGLVTIGFAKVAVESPDVVRVEVVSISWPS